jgi:hypothetical protein
MKNQQAYFLNVTFYKLSNPNQVRTISEYHFNYDSALKTIKRLEFMGYTIQNQSVKFEQKNYSQVG